MDIEIDIECGHCGHEYSESFKLMRHGQALRCPFCSSFSLTLKCDHPVETPEEVEAFERPEGKRPDTKHKT